MRRRAFSSRVRNRRANSAKSMLAATISVQLVAARWSYAFDFTAAKHGRDHWQTNVTMLPAFVSPAKRARFQLCFVWVSTCESSRDGVHVPHRVTLLVSAALAPPFKLPPLRDSAAASPPSASPSPRPGRATVTVPLTHCQAGRPDSPARRPRPPSGKFKFNLKFRSSSLSGLRPAPPGPSPSRLPVLSHK
eukprot:3059323-Rhodomonas_salina.2